MEQDKKAIEPDNTAVRTALWRALHVQVDPQPHIIEDEIGLQLIAPNDGWQQRPDMDTNFTRRIRVSMAARARFVDDLVIDQSKKGITQYVILGAGLDTFAQRRPDIAANLQLFEIDRPDTQTWKQQRLLELGFGIPEGLHFVPVNFETDSSWWEKLVRSGFDRSKPAVVACAGVSMYLTRDANLALLRQVKSLAAGSILALTFLLPLELVEEADQQLLQISMKGAQSSGNPFISFFSPEAILELAKEAGFENAEVVSKADMVKSYFADRTDQLSPASGEEFLLATT
jgi:methyltransferase (TIGR00027 family)